ncbi:MAG: carboxypeptidase-like regulatory domain-containing protein [Saprospiraceae bacterium]|nr:carboxypeptidase-like regulatory domain-containing protein [Saprospiraceae bacterium]
MKKIFFLFYLIIYAQTSVCQGVNGYIKDKTQQPLISATLQFINLQTKGEKFLFSDNKGNFEIKLDVGKYKLITRYLGYKNDVREIEISSNVVIELNITLYEDENIIHEVEIIAAPPAMIQKKDTTIYFADSFAIGDERKLRELLEKFPGLTVEGNKVMFKGKPITKLMVENKDFFTGSVAFGINNLPADAVSSVEVLQNYSEVAFLKDKFYGDDIALNVKLKKIKVTLYLEILKVLSPIPKTTTES